MGSCYIISTYSYGDDYSESAFLASSIEDVCSMVETNECDWQEGIYNYAIVWKLNTGYLGTGHTDIAGVYNVSKKDWVDFSVEKNSCDKTVICFDNVTLIIGDRVGPNLTQRYKKERFL